MNTMPRIAIALSVLLLAACSRRENEEPPTPAATAGLPAVVEKDPVVPPPVITPVTVKVTLSSAAAAEVQKSGKGIALEATYGGDPRSDAANKVNDLGLIELGKAQLILNGADTVKLTEDVIDKGRLAMVLGQPQIMLNAVSEAKPNFLACKFYWDTLATAGKGVVELPCKLLSEGEPET